VVAAVYYRHKNWLVTTDPCGTQMLLVRWSVPLVVKMRAVRFYVTERCPDMNVDTLHMNMNMVRGVP
jgi:hypothetical protein